mmetsp:Transcript_83368/g.241235  ORF Transcript_83368/g.241235 Transcript_83368/m.241235 type:complete len:380 (-) Transcript_83368:516-1655(-)
MGCSASSADKADMEIVTERCAPLNMFHKEYILDVTDKLGQGVVGTVYSAKKAMDDQADVNVAVKVIDLRESEARGLLKKSVDREVAICKSLPKSPNLVSILSCSTAGFLCYIVMEKCEMSLLQALDRMLLYTEAKLKPIFSDVISGIEVCHTAGVVHRNIKFTNFLAVPSPSGCIVKLCDFGLAKQVCDASARELKSLTGTPRFMAPEMIRGEVYSGKVDIWAVGVMAYMLLFGAWPYAPGGLDGQAVQAAIVAGSPPPPFDAGDGMPVVSQSAVAWVRAMLRRCESARPAARVARQLPDFLADWGSAVSLRPALDAAKRSGAFGKLSARGLSQATELDNLLLDLRVAQHPQAAKSCGDVVAEKQISEISTAISRTRST